MNFSLQASASRIFLWQRANHAIYLARNILLALYITPAEFGDFAIALNLATYIAIFGTLEFRTAFFTTKELTPEQLRAQWSAEVTLSALTLILGLLLSPWLATTRAGGIVTAMLCLLVVNLIEASFSTHLYLLEKDLRFPFITALYTVVNLVSFIVCLALAIMGWGLGALVADRLIAASAKWFVLGRKSDWRPQFQIELRSLLHYWSSIRVLFLNGLLGKVLFGFDIYAIGKWIGSEANGIYAMAMKWAMLPMELGAGFLAIMALSLYSRQSHDNMETFRASYTEVTFYIVRFCLAIAVLMTIFMSDFFRVFYRNDWQAVPAIFCALLPYAMFRPLYQNVCQALQARKILWPIFWVMVVQSILVVALILLSISSGLVCVALAAGAALGLGYIALELHLHRSARHPLVFLFAAPLVLAALAAATHLLMAHNSGFGVRVGLAAAYGAIAAWEWWSGRRRFSKPPASAS